MTYNLFDCRIIPTEVCNELVHRQFERTLSDFTNLGREVEKYKADVEERISVLAYENRSLREQVEQLGATPDIINMTKDLAERVNALDNHMRLETMNMKSNMAKMEEKFDRYVEKEMNQEKEKHVHALRDTSASGSKDVDKIEQPLQQADIAAANLQCSLETGQADMNMTVTEDETKSDSESHEQSDTIIIAIEDETESNSIHDVSPQNSSSKSILKKKPVVKPTRSQDSSNTYTSAGSEPEKNNATIKTRRHITFATANETFFFDYDLSIAEEEPEVRFTRAPSPPPSYYESYEQSDTNMIFIEDETESDSESHEQYDMNMTVIEDETESDSEPHEQSDMNMTVIEDEAESDSESHEQSDMNMTIIEDETESDSESHEQSDMNMTVIEDETESDSESHEQSDMNMTVIEDETESDSESHEQYDMNMTVIEDETESDAESESDSESHEQYDMNMTVTEDETESDTESYEQSDMIIIVIEDETESNSIHDGSPQNGSSKSILKKKPVVKPTRSQDSSNTYTSAGSEPEKNNATIKTRRHITFATANDLSIAEEEPEVRFTRAPSPPPSYYESHEQSDTNMIFMEDETESDSESHEQSDMYMIVTGHEQSDMYMNATGDKTESRLYTSYFWWDCAEEEEAG
jgi:hypothetical protein